MKYSTEGTDVFVHVYQDDERSFVAKAINARAAQRIAQALDTLDWLEDKE